MTISALGLALLPVACLGSADDMDAPTLKAPSRETLGDPSGSTGNNGLPSVEFLANETDLLLTTKKPIDSGDPSINLVAEQIGLLNTDGGRHTFKYSMRCGLDLNTSVFDSNNTEYPGGGMLSTTNGWLNAPLSDSARDDLFACMLAHLNPFGVEVPIRLTGSSVPNQATDVSDFTFQEALWIANISSATTGVKYEVWPLPSLKNCFGPITSAAIETRVCGQGNPVCGLQVHADMNACVQDANTHNWTCQGKPAIQTWLKADDVATLYGISCLPS